MFWISNNINKRMLISFSLLAGATFHWRSTYGLFLSLFVRKHNSGVQILTPLKLRPVSWPKLRSSSEMVLYSERRALRSVGNKHYKRPVSALAKAYQRPARLWLWSILENGRDTSSMGRRQWQPQCAAAWDWATFCATFLMLKKADK